MCKKTFEVCGGPCATSGKLAASVAVILLKGNRLWNADPSKPGESYKHNIIWSNMLNTSQNVSKAYLVSHIWYSKKK